MKKLHRIKDWVFNQVHSKNLVYNTCWEDPRCDRELLEFDANSNVVMITSAGCNALDYLLDGPAKINCVDVNFRQNALLQLKMATFRHTDYETLYQLFGKGFHPDIRNLYQEDLRPHLPEFAQAYWDKNINFFNGKGPRKTFYHYGTSGIFAWMASKYIKARKPLYKKITQLLNAQSLEEQTRIYDQIEPKLTGRIMEWLVNRHFAMSLLGVPRSQQELFVREYEKGALGYIQECLRKVFTELPIQDNYFWRLYLDGAYTSECSPEYLKAHHFETLAQRVDRIQTNITTITEYLRANPGPYSHFILLDHQDWLAANNRPALEEEWQLILQNSRPGTKILLRSAAQEVDFFPDFVLDRLVFEKEKTVSTHHKDRVGTYASVYLGIVQ